MAKRNRITDEQKEKIRALLATGKSNRAIAREVGVSESSVRKIKAEEPEEELAAAHEAKKKEFIDRAWDEIMAAITELANKRTFAEYKELVTSIGILIDKVMLAQGEPTGRQKLDVSGQVEQKYVYEITQKVLSDPDAREQARDLFRRAVSRDMES